MSINTTTLINSNEDSHNNRIEIFNSLAGKILCVADIRGKLNLFFNGFLNGFYINF